MDDAILHQIVGYVVEILLLLISALVAKYLVPWLKQKNLYNTVMVFVSAAEKLAESGQIEKVDKKEYVINLLMQKGIKVTPIVDAIIEACIKQLDMALKKENPE